MPQALFTNRVFWILTRASGYLALALFFSSALWGVAIQAGVLDKALARWAVRDLDRYGSWSASAPWRFPSSPS
ncbi:MAG: hypothetical protein KM310_06840 [Clostridiales bacterium]|nr:hypothetical protein [Clostridiales bacterium]